MEWLRAESRPARALGTTEQPPGTVRNVGRMGKGGTGEVRSKRTLKKRRRCIKCDVARNKL